MYDPGEVIRSTDNKTIKGVRSLRNRGQRESERAFVVEGVRAVEDAIIAGGEVKTLLVREDVDWIAPGGTPPVRRVARSLFDQLADTVTPQGVLGVFAQPVLPLPATSRPLVLILDRLSDPGNLGTVLRAAAGAGAGAVLLTPGTVDPYNPKVVRSAMGAHFRLPIRWQGDAEAHSMLEQCGVWAIAEANGEQCYDEVDWSQGAAIVIGSEAHGVAPELIRQSTCRIRIPLAGGVESLNAGVAAAVILFEAARQRRKSCGKS